MKYNNLKSAIHNFTHSIISRDYSHSGKLVHNILIKLKNHNLLPQVKLNFIDGTIQPNEAIDDSSKKLLLDYRNWLPEHLENHKCSISELELFEIIVFADFDKAYHLKNAEDYLRIKFIAILNWKIKGKENESREIWIEEDLLQEDLINGLYEF